MKLTLDRESETLSFRLDGADIVVSEEVQPGVILDFNAHGRVVGVEMLHISERADPQQLKTRHFETA